MSAIPAYEWTLGKLLFHARIECGMEQQKLAELCGVSAGAISNWEADRAEPSHANFLKACYYLKDAPWLYRAGLELIFSELGLPEDFSPWDWYTARDLNPEPADQQVHFGHKRINHLALVT